MSGIESEIQRLEATEQDLRSRLEAIGDVEERLQHVLDARKAEEE